MSSFIAVGNSLQPFTRLLDKVVELAPCLPQPVTVQHGHTSFQCPFFEAHAFLPLELFSEKLRQADLVVLHAGAGSVIHAVRAGKVPVVMPRRVAYGEIVDDHQAEFAMELAQAEKVIVAMEAAELEAAIFRALARQAAAPNQELRPPPLVALIRERLEAYAWNPLERGN